MTIAHERRRIIAGALMSFGVAIAGLGLGQGTAQALPGGPVPLGSWPGCPEDNPSGPCHSCPGDPPVQTGNLRVNPVIWDNNVCHTYWYVYHGQGNVAQNIFEGEIPPPPPPPPPNLTPPSRRDGAGPLSSRRRRARDSRAESVTLKLPCKS